MGLSFLAVLAIVGPAVWGGELATSMHIAAATQGPSQAHLLGTDELGRDILARTLSATRLSLALGLAASAVTLLIGFPLGALIAMLGPRLRETGRGLISAFLSFPPLLFAIVVITIIGPGVKGAVLAVGIGGVPYAARIAESLASSAVSRDYIASARVIGVRRGRLLGRYILPNIAETLVITGLSAVAESIIDVSALSFLGLGVQPPAYDWGSLLATGVQEIYVIPMAALGPATMIALTGLILTFTAEALARALNPVLWTGGVKALRPPRFSLLAPLARAATRSRRSPDQEQPPEASALLQVRDLKVTFPGSNEPVTPVRGISFDIAPGEVVGIVGESGSGKSLSALAIAQLVPNPGRVAAETLKISGFELQGLSERKLRKLLGTRMAMVFQNPMASLNPAMRVGPQLTDGARTHRGMGRKSATMQARQALTEVNIPRPDVVLRRYPFELSGGMRQRAMIAMGLMTEPDLIIADEPTTALDVTTQAQVLEVMRRINIDHGTAILFISHNLGVISEVCGRVLVMYAGRLVEDLPVASLEAPLHPYTRALLAAVPSLETDTQATLATIPGEPPVLDHQITGCAFAPRCPLVIAKCRAEDPELVECGDGRHVACWVATAELDRQAINDE